MELKLVFFDFEVFKQDWFVTFLDDKENKYTTFRNDELGLIDYIERRKKDTCFIGYNNKHFDNYCIKCIYNGINPYKIVDWVIKKGNVPWTLPEFKYKKNVDFISYDLMVGNLNPISLKTCEANLGLNIEEMNFDTEFGGKLNDEQYEKLLKYNKWDVSSTQKVFYSFDTYHRSMFESFKAKKTLIDIYPERLDYKDMALTFPQLTAKLFDAKAIPQVDSYKYVKPKCIEIEDKEVVDNYENHESLWKEEFSFEKRIQDVIYQFAIGGGHGALENFIYEVNNENYIVCADVSSLYPNLMYNKKNNEFSYLTRCINQPAEFGNIIAKRLDYKHKGMEAESAALKLPINSTFGASLQSYGNGKPGPLTDWVNGRNVCITGQLCLWMLAEMISKISTTKIFNLNTDGIYFIINKSYLDKANDVMKYWQDKLGLELEIDVIKKGKIVQKDVNNYMLYDADKNKVKVKGNINKWQGGSYVNNNASIIDEALVKYFIYNKPINETIIEAFEKNEVIKFQVILSRKGKNFTESYWGNNVVQKVNRVFATTDDSCPEVTKLKNGTKYSFPDAPKHAFVYNKDVSTLNLKDISLDINYYINLTNKKIKQYVGK